jgi:hypothetical protein
MGDAVSEQTVSTPTTQEAAALQEATSLALVAAMKAHAIGLAEVPVAARLAAKVNTGHGLSTQEAREAWRLLSRYGPAVRAAGIEIPGLAAAQPAPAVRPQVATRPTYVPQVVIRGHAGRQRKNQYNQHITVTDIPFAANDAIKAVAHALWDDERRCWHTPATPAHAAALLSVLEPFAPVCSERVSELAQEFATMAQRRAVLHPDAPEPDFPTAHLVNGTLWGHQMRAVRFSASVTASMLAIRMGGGKTAATIALANDIGARRVVIVCPNKVRGVWPREVGKWSARTWHIVDGKRESRRKGGRRQDLKLPERLAQAEECLFDCPCGAAVHAAVMNYEMLVHEPVASWRASQPIDLAIYDEVHRAKSPTGRMSVNLSKWVDFTHKRVGLSGTPMPQYPWDIFGVYRALDPGIFGLLWTPFKGQYVQMRTREDDGQKFPVAILPEQRAEFSRLVHSIMYRPTVDLKLPEVTHYARTVEFEPDARREYERLENELWADLTDFAAITPVGDVDPVMMADLDKILADELGQFQDLYDTELFGTGVEQATLTPRNVLARLLRLMQATGGTLPTDEGDKRRFSTAKSDALMEFDGNHPAGGLLYEAGCYPQHPGGAEPVCVYAHFRDDLDAIRAVAERAGLRYREISGRRGDGLTEASEMAPDADVVGVQIQSGGTGVDLTRSCYGIWYSKGHSLGDYDQALARQHRPGQTRPVTFVHLEVADTIDHDVYRSLMCRRSVVAGVLSIRGLNHPGLGGDGNPESPLPVDTVMSGAARGDGGGVHLPIDEFGVDVMGDPRPPVRAVLSQAQRDALWLDDVLT